MRNFNRDRTKKISLCMYILAAVSTVVTIIGLVVYNQPSCRFYQESPYWDYEHNSEYDNGQPCYMRTMVGAGIWGPAFTWPAAILAHMASRKDSSTCLVVSHLVMCILSCLLTIAAFIADAIILSTNWGRNYWRGGDPNEVAKAVISMMSVSTITLFALSILSLCSAGFSCYYVCCRYRCCKTGKKETTVATVNNPLLGVQVVRNGDVRYFPVGNRDVSEIITNNGRMVVLNMNDVPTNLAPTSSSVPDAAPPAYTELTHKPVPADSTVQ